MTTTHQFLPLYPIDPHSRKLIVGTIHPHDHSGFKIPFFYGNRGSIWTILHEAFPAELSDPFCLDAIQAFLKNRKIAMSDTILECRRKAPTALDSDLIPIRLNHGMIEEIRRSNIREIFFTSGFGTNNAFKLFLVDILKQKLTSEIRRQKEYTLSPGIFGRPVRLRALISPAGTANISLSKDALYLANSHRYTGSKRPVQDFKVDWYREIFSA
ncbi:MAG TPA: hypothetical protein VI233_04070 [Puia sp.]